MSEAIGRIEILPDPLALARRVAGWMTEAALAAKEPFRVSLSGGSTPKTLYGLSPRTSSGTGSRGRGSPGIGATSACSP